MQSAIDTSLTFVIGKIEEEAERQGAPLDEEERLLLRDLPVVATSRWPGLGTPEIVVQDREYARLCKLAKAAHRRDVSSRPVAEKDWELAVAIFRVGHHPMLRLLKWAGLKEKRPWWDGWLLLATALTVIAAFMGCIFLFTSSPPADHATRAILTRAAIGAGCVVAMVGLYSATRSLARRDARKTIERFRDSFSSARKGF
jgi:hypothetical protein